MLMIVVLAALIVLMAIQGKLGSTGRTVTLVFLAGCSLMWAIYHPGKAATLQASTMNVLSGCYDALCSAINAIRAQV